MTGRAGPHDLGEAGYADAHQLALLALLLLFAAQVMVADDVHGLFQGSLVVAAVVFPAKHRAVGEGFRLDEVLDAELGRVYPQLVGHDVGHSLDGIYGLGYPEGTPVSDAAGRFVGVYAVDLDKGVFEIVRAGADVEQTGGELGGIAGRVGVAVVGYRLDPQGLHRAVPPGGDLGGYVVVPGEGSGHQVFHPVLDPLDRLPGQERRGDGQHVPGVDRDLASETAAYVRGNDPYLVFGQPQMRAYQRDHRTDDMGRLGSHPDRQLFLHRVPLGHAAAGLDGRNVDARDVDVLFDRYFAAAKGLFGAGPVPGLPVPDVVALLRFVLPDDG